MFPSSRGYLVMSSPRFPHDSTPYTHEPNPSHIGGVTESESCTPTPLHTAITQNTWANTLERGPCQQSFASDFNRWRGSREELQWNDLRHNSSDTARAVLQFPK